MAEFFSKRAGTGKRATTKAKSKRAAPMVKKKSNRTAVKSKKKSGSDRR